LARRDIVVSPSNVLFRSVGSCSCTTPTRTLRRGAARSRRHGHVSCRCRLVVCIRTAGAHCSSLIGVQTRSAALRSDIRWRWHASRLTRCGYNRPTPSIPPCVGQRRVTLLRRRPSTHPLAGQEALASWNISCRTTKHDRSTHTSCHRHQSLPVPVER
jgi:hypothetical protein